MGKLVPFNPDDLPNELYEFRSPLGPNPVAVNSKTPLEVWRILIQVEDGMMSVRKAADILNWTMDDVQMVMWGEIRI